MVKNSFVNMRVTGKMTSKRDSVIFIIRINLSI
jgi:hypothetical protein